MAIEAAGGWAWQTVDATDPIERPVAARWLRSADGARAVIELAEASGLSRLAAADEIRSYPRRGGPARSSARCWLQIAASPSGSRAAPPPMAAPGS